MWDARPRLQLRAPVYLSPVVGTYLCNLKEEGNSETFRLFLHLQAHVKLLKINIQNIRKKYTYMCAYKYVRIFAQIKYI